MVNHGKRGQLSYTQKRQNLKELCHTALANFARDGADTWTAFCLLEDIQFEVLNAHFDLDGFEVLLENSPRRKKELQERYDAVMLSLAGCGGLLKEYIDFVAAYFVMRNVLLDLLYDELKVDVTE
jgi:hypothetical protein